MRTSYSYFILIILFISIRNICAQTPFVLSDSVEQRCLNGEYISVYIDTSKSISIADISSDYYSEKFTKYSSEPYNSPIDAAHWIRFKIKNNSSKDKKWLVEFFDHNINNIFFYTPVRGNTFIEKQTGNLNLFNERLIKHKNFEFDINTDSGKVDTYYFKIETSNKNIITPELRSYKKFIEYALSEYYFLGLFYGILLMMAIYNFILFIIIKRKVYFLYVGYVICFCLYSMCQNGFAFQYLWPNFPDFNPYANHIFLYFSIVLSLLFTKNVLNLSENHKKANKIIDYIIILRTVFFILLNLTPLQVTDLTCIEIIPLSAAFITGVVCLKEGNPASKYFLLAYSFLFCSFFITILEQYGLIESGIFTVYSLNFGIVLEIIFLSISIAANMRKEIQLKEAAQKQAMKELREKELLKDKINKELESKVQERTEQLKLANDKLRQQAEDITKMNIALDIANHNLKNDVKEIAKTRVLHSLVQFQDFTKVFPDELSCYRFLEELKKKVPFNCKKCNSGSCGKGKELFDRRCTKCGYNESITANTIFHKLKFPIVKAFYIIYLVTVKKEITADELSEIVELRRTTCSIFKKKIFDRMQVKGRKRFESWEELVLDSGLEQLQTQIH